MPRQLASSDKARKFYRMSFELRDNGKLLHLHTMMINPSELSLNDPARITPTQTLGGAYVSDFGEGLPTLSITGTTGFAKRLYENGRERDGYTEWKLLRDDIYRKYVTSKSTKMEMMWFNWEDGEFYKIVPLNMRLQRSKSEPLLFRYEFQFTCVQRLTSVTARENMEHRSWANLNDKQFSVSSELSELNELIDSFKKVVS